jgi:hypothetical protein
MNPTAGSAGDLDTTIAAMDLTAQEMNAKYKGDIRRRLSRICGALLEISDGSDNKTAGRQRAD